MDWQPNHPEPDQEPPERFWNDLDLDDIAESFIGSLAAGLVLLLVAWVCMRRRHACYAEDGQQRSR
ncbi:MAG: hypothetical protein WC211_09425 [Dehalococcoidia bacterium]